MVAARIAAALTDCCAFCRSHGHHAGRRHGFIGDVAVVERLLQHGVCKHLAPDDVGGLTLDKRWTDCTRCWSA